MKKTKIMSIIAALALSFTVLSGCGSDPIQDDLTNYVNNQLPAVQTTETALKDTLNANVGDNYTDDETLLTALNDSVLPLSVDVLAAAEKIVPATEEVAALHKQYVTSLTTLNSALTMLVEALSTGDGDMATEANDLLITAQTQDDEFVAAVAALAKDHGLKLK